MQHEKLDDHRRRRHLLIHSLLFLIAITTHHLHVITFLRCFRVFTCIAEIGQVDENVCCTRLSVCGWDFSSFWIIHRKYDMLYYAYVLMCNSAWILFGSFNLWPDMVFNFVEKKLRQLHAFATESGGKFNDYLINVQDTQWTRSCSCLEYLIHYSIHLFVCFFFLRSLLLRASFIR